MKVRVTMSSAGIAVPLIVYERTWTEGHFPVWIPHPLFPGSVFERNHLRLAMECGTVIRFETTEETSPNGEKAK